MFPARRLTPLSAALSLALALGACGESSTPESYGADTANTKAGVAPVAEPPEHGTASAAHDAAEAPAMAEAEAPAVATVEAPALETHDGVDAKHASPEVTATAETAKATKAPTVGGEPLGVAGTAERGAWGVETDYLSSDVRAGDDFYRYVNEGWLTTAELPTGFASNGVFVELHLKAEEQVRVIIEDAKAAAGTADSPEGMIAALHEAYMDTDRIEALGLTPVQEGLDEIASMQNHADMARVMGRPFHVAIVGLGVMVDPGNPERHVLATSQAGLGLPGRDYYLREDAPFPDHRAAYVDYIAGLFERAGYQQGKARAEAILAFETQLAELHWTPEERRDRVRNYHLMTRGELDDYAGRFPWTPFFDELGLAEADEIVVGTDTAVRDTTALLAATDFALVRDWMTFHYLNNLAGLLPKAWRDAQWEFYSKRLNGVAEQRPREKRAIAFVNRTLGELVGEVYVDKHFPPAHKAQMERLVGYLSRAFRERLEANPWMDDETRAEALAKLEAFTPKIGFPDRWHDYSGLVLEDDALIGNVRAVKAWAWEDEKAKLAEPPREWEWGMTPQTVNAYYSPTRNEIVFPAAILQAPFFDPAADPAVNFAAIGGVIGHEMGHGFDDQGSRSDATGKLRNWWTDKARAEFEKRAKVLVEQYNAFEPIEGLHVNGELTLGENIGDVGGLTVAYHAWRLYVDEVLGGKAPVVDGFSGDQRFFLSWAQVWRTLQTEDSERDQVLTDPHSPARYRVNGVVRNHDAWYEAFKVKKGDALFLPKAERVSIW